ncbi:hypothetical protein OsJ_20473 [Oryza sativa Japonica Group]|uniref:Uncharacterized protein n=1 Tax=Oryza sativa subsp. japonica TaxID=39947 RepID=B9FS06_ORYSJ|nr:hypothetical protein OsJ_20473 [Oryza sativa Japonica Group]
MEIGHQTTGIARIGAWLQFFQEDLPEISQGPEEWVQADVDAVLKSPWPIKHTGGRWLISMQGPECSMSPCATLCLAGAYWLPKIPSHWQSISAYCHGRTSLVVIGTTDSFLDHADDLMKYTKFEICRDGALSCESKKGHPERDTSRSKAELTITGDSESHSAVDKDYAGEIGGGEGEADYVSCCGVNGTVAREGAVLEGLDNRSQEAGAADREA